MVNPSETSFPWPWSGPTSRRLAVVGLLWILALNVWGVIAIDLLPISRKSPWDPQANLRAPLYARYDSGWYDAIIRYGYQKPPEPGQPSAHAFFPLYPMLGRLLHLGTGIDSFQSGLLVSYAAFLFALPLFLEEAALRFGGERAMKTLPFLLLYPVSFFLAAVYTESVFLLLALLAFRDVRRGRPGAAALWGFLLGLTRAPAVAAGPAFALAFLLLHRERARRLGEAILVGLAPFAGVALWIFGIGLGKGEPFLYFRAMGAWRQAAGNPAAGIPAFVEEAIQMARSGHFASHPGALAPYAHFVLLLLVGSWLLWRRRWPEAAWVLGIPAIAVVTGTSAGIPRYSLTVFPLHFALFELLEGRPLLTRLWLGLAAAVLLLNTAFFVNWHFVS